jgi:hypothetical protein
MAYPVAKIYIAFDDGPYVLSPTWTEVTSSVRSMSIDRGRSDDWGTFSGSATVELNNRSRLYDPFYTSGTYYGKLLPRRQIKIEATYSGTTYPVFRGFIDGWPPTWTDAGGDSTVTLSCYDAMALLAQVQLPADWSRETIIATLPRHYYSCDDPIIPLTTGVLTDSGFVPKNLTTTTVATSGQQLATGLVNRSLSGVSDSAITSIATNSIGYPETAVFTADSDFTVAFWIIPQTTTSTQVVSGQISNFLWAVNFSADKFNFQVETASGVVPNFWSWTTTTQPINAAEPVHFAAVFSQATKTAVLYLNGINVTGTRSTASPITLQSNADVISIFQGPIQQIVLETYALTQATIQSIIRSSVAVFNETTAARVARIIAQTPFSSSLVSAGGSQSIAEITDDAPYAGPELQITANTEGGPLFVSKLGVLTQKSTYAQFTDAKSFTSQAVYGSGGLGLDPEITIQYDGDSMRNIINVNMTGGGVQKVTGSVATTVYGQATQTWDAYMPTVAQAKTIGNVLVGFGQYVYPKYDDFQVVINPNSNWASTLDLELLERITVAVAPPTGNTITKDLQVNRIRHDVAPGVWRTTLNGSARWASAFRLDYSVLDGPDVLVYTG